MVWWKEGRNRDQRKEQQENCVVFVLGCLNRE